MSNSAAIALIDAMPTSRIIHAAAALGLAAVLTACAASTGAASSAAAPPPALDFGPCPKDLSTPYPTLTCASMPVPVDHSVPAGATTTVLDGRDYLGLASIGTNPTFAGSARTVEAWLLDFNGALYGEELALRDFRFVRGQLRFDSVDALVAQMRDDAATVKFPSVV